MVVKYSIIVPVFNVESVLKRCVDSIIKQTITDFECILVDDGSTDRSGEICDKYSKEDKRIKVIHTSNAGVSKARNIGLSMAQGINIVFVDSDDFVEPYFLSAFEAQDFDLIMASSYTREEDLSIKTKNSLDNKKLYNLDDTLLISILNSWQSQIVWAKCFKRRIIESENILFIDDCNYGEDTIFVATYLKNCSSVCMIDQCIYNHCLYERSTLSKLIYDEKIEKYHKIVEVICKLFSGRKQIQTALLKKYWWIIELEIKQIFMDDTITSRLKTEIVYSYLEKPMSLLCLKSNIVDFNWKTLIYKSRSKGLLYCWLRVNEIAKKR